MFRLLRYFTTFSATAIFAVASVLVYQYRQNAVSDVLVSVESRNVSLTRTFSNMLWPRFSGYVTAIETPGAITARTQKAMRDIDSQVQKLVRGLPILKVRIHNLNGLTVYSSDAVNIGRIVRGESREYLSARRGKPASTLTFHERFSGYSGVLAKRDVVESHVPIWGIDDTVEGVFEIHSDVTPLIAVVKERTNILTVGLLLAFTVLYVFLFKILRNAERIVTSKQTELLEKIEESKRTESEMTRQSLLLKTTVEIMAQGVIVYDADLKILACNERFNDMFGFPHGFVRPGMTLEDIARFRAEAGHFGPGNPETLARDRVRRAKESTERSAERTLLDGTSYVYHRKPMPDGGIVVTYTDITERKRAREQLIQKSALLETTLDNMSHGIVVEDAEFRILAFNEKSVELRDYPPGFFRIGMSAEELYRYKAENGYYGPGDVEALVARRMESRRRKGKHRQERTRADGRVVISHREPMPGGGHVTTYSDITDSKRAEENLRIAKEQAESANRSKSEFLANMSHELRTPLNSIIGFTELMMKASFGPLGHEKYAEFTADVNASGHHLLGLINNILDLSKIEAGKYEMNEESFDVAGVVAACLRLLKVQAETNGVTLESDVSDSLVPLHADQGMVKQIILNLLSNAIKFTPEGGKVTLKAWAQPGNGLVFQVIDTGIGVSLSDIPKILKPFTQIQNAYNRNHQGTGLGLSLCKHLIELHGGYLDFQSEVGAGTVVTVRFPKERIAAPAADSRNSVAV